MYTKKNYNEFLEDYSELLETHPREVGFRTSRYYNRDTQQWEDQWVITVDGWPQ